MDVPFVLSETDRIGTYVNLTTHLLAERTIFLGAELENAAANSIAMQLMSLAQNTDPINFYINSFGGSVPAGLAVVDVIEATKRRGVPVHTCCLGECHGIAAAILACGTRGRRSAFPNSRISLHQDWYGTESLLGGTIEAAHEERDRLMTVVTSIFAATTTVSSQHIDQEVRVLRFMDPKRAQELGVIDQIVG